MEEKQERIILVDEEGEEEEFMWLDTVEMDSSKYVVLLPVDSEDEPVAVVDESEEDDDVQTEEDFEEYEDEKEVIILKVVGKSGEEAFAPIEDEDELDRVFEVFLSGYEEEAEL